MLVEKAHAKINLFLQVTGKRSDGYHTLNSVMVPLALHDTLTFTPAPTDTLSLTCDHAPTKNRADNLVYRVARAMQAHFSLGGVEIHLKKQIPVAAGLGGGSADAAATLRGLNRLFNLGLSLKALAEFGVTFGADIPFCVFERPAQVQGKGEILTFLPEKDPIPVWLWTPDIAVSTKTVFAHVEAKHYANKTPDDLLAAWTKNQPTHIQALCENGLSEVAENVHPELAEIRRQIAVRTQKSVQMSGSGPTLFIIGPEAKMMHHDELMGLPFRFTRLTNTLEPLDIDQKKI